MEGCELEEQEECQYYSNLIKEKKTMMRNVAANIYE
jgi:hypothetical protein